MALVTTGNHIYVPLASINTTQVVVEWQANLKATQQNYFAAPFMNRDAGDLMSIIFIQTNYLDSFKAKRIPGQEELTVIVDSSFQCGQAVDKSMRWLVYHDKKQIPDQWRFMAAIITKMGPNLNWFAAGALRDFIASSPVNLQATFKRLLNNC